MDYYVEVSSSSKEYQVQKRTPLEKEVQKRTKLHEKDKK